MAPCLVGVNYGRVENSFGGVELAVEICQIFKVGYNIRRMLVH
jgi:hypothetical protein